MSGETIRRLGQKFGPDDARRVHRKPPRPDDIWHLDEVVISIAGKKHWLWRAVDQNGYGLDEIVQTRRNSKAARRLLNRLLRKQGRHPSAGSPASWAPTRGEEAGHAQGRPSRAEGVEHPGREQPCPLLPCLLQPCLLQPYPLSKARADHSAFPIGTSPSAPRLDRLRLPQSLRPARSKRSAPGIDLHRPYALAPWKSVSLGA